MVDDMDPGAGGAIKSSRRPVGYKSPPAEHRWKKGVSGNPSGKRKGANAHDTIVSEMFGKPRIHPLTESQRLLLAELSRPLKMRDGDKVTTARAEQVILTGLVRAAAKGDMKAVREIGRRLIPIEIGKAAKQALQAEAAAKYRAHGLAILEHARLHSTPAPEILPHPDDVVIDAEFGVQFLGPTTVEEKLALEALVKRLPELCTTLGKVSRQTRLGDRNPGLLAQHELLEEQIGMAVAYRDRKARREQARHALEGGSLIVPSASDLEAQS